MPWSSGVEPVTNVVCEGYAKAFQYLCELTDWEGDVSCISVTGRMGTSTTRTENHMWNVVRVNGMRACLVDVTNCDGGHLGAPDKLYMIRPRITDRNWYCTQNPQVYYSYDSSTLSLFREQHLVHVIEDGGDGVRYELCHSHHDEIDDDLHVHFYCEQCHQTYCLDHIPVPGIELPEGFIMESVNYMVKGICPHCAYKTHRA